MPLAAVVREPAAKLDAITLADELEHAFARSRVSWRDRRPIAGQEGPLIGLVLTPIPLTNIVPALVIAVISLASLEEDGLALSIARLAAVLVLTVEVVAVCEAALGARWMSGLW